MSDSEIKEKYLKAPSFEEIESFIDELDISYTQFERYFSMHDGLIKHIKRGAQKLPVKHWPIIYERIVPQYGIGYKNNIVKRNGRKVVERVVARQLENDTHGRVNKIK